MMNTFFSSQLRFRFHHFVGIILILMLALMTLLAPRSSPTYAQQNLAFILEASQESVVAGKPITFTGRNFIPRERLTYWATTPDEAVISGKFIKAGSEGAFSFTFNVPHDAISGRWAMTVWGDASKTPVVVQFEVIGRNPDTTRPVASAWPEQGPPGTTFLFSARGYRTSERVSYWITAPDNTIAFSRHRGAKPDKHGTIEIRWTAPANAKPGRWVITMQGLRSSAARAIPFTIEEPAPAPQP